MYRPSSAASSAIRASFRAEENARSLIVSTRCLATWYWLMIRPTHTPIASAPVLPQPRPSFTLDQITAYPFPAELTASARGTRIAFTLNERGSRNLWVAEGPSFTPRKLTSWDADDGQEIVNVSLSADGQWIAFARGGDHGSNFDGLQLLLPEADLRQEARAALRSSARVSR